MEGLVTQDPKLSLSWVAHPFKRRPRRGWLTLGISLAVALAAGYITRSGFWAGFSLLVLFLSLESFYLPTRFHLSSESVEIRKSFSRSSTPWETFRRVYEDRYGLTLSPYRRRAFLEPYRSQRLLYDGGEPEQIRRAVRAFLRPGSEWIDPEGRTESVGTSTDHPNSDPSIGSGPAILEALSARSAEEARTRERETGIESNPPPARRAWS